MKKSYLLIMCVALFFIQCKRKTELIVASEKTVAIKLDVGGSKVNVNPNSGAVLFEDGDEIIVSNNGRYIGKLLYNNGTFEGEVTGASSDDYLHFYFLGNQKVDDLIVGSSTECSVTISDQVFSLPVISYGHSTSKYSPELTFYTAKLDNKCTLVKFSVESASEYAGVCITGMNNRASIDFADNTFSYDTVNNGNITLSPKSGIKYAILFPQEEQPEGGDGSAFAGKYKGTRGYVPEILVNINMALDDYTIPVTITTPTIPEGAINGLFAVDSTGKQVYFSKSNLSYKISQKEWSFLPYQYTVMESYPFSTGENCSQMNVVTLFGWATSGYDHGSIYYKPYNTITDMNGYNAYGDIYGNLYDEDGRADWGYNMIKYGGLAHKQWRTPTYNEWKYLFKGRTGAAEKWGLAIINNKYKGCVLLPDDWTEPYSNCFVSGMGNEYDTNKYTLNQWALMEAAGAVFFPSASNRFGTSVANLNYMAFIWSSTVANKTFAQSVQITPTLLDLERQFTKRNGLSVRLICE